MYNTKILTANNYGSFENLYEDFRKKAKTDYNFELEPLDYDGFLDAIDKDLIKCIVLYDEEKAVGFLVYTTAISESIELNINEEIYSNAVIAYEKTNDCDVLIKTAELFESICGYKDSDDLAKACIQKSEDIKKDNIYNDAGVLAASEKIESLESAIKK